MTARRPPESRPVVTRTVLLMVEYTDRGTRVSHCEPSAALAALASDEMLDRTPPNLPELGMRTLQEWMYAYGHGEWSRGKHAKQNEVPA
jgi:hypothetical protein